MIRPGYWTDVFARPDGTFGQVTTDGALVRCFLGAGLAWSQTASEPLMFCRCAVVNGAVVSIHQGNETGRAWLIRQGAAQDLGPTFGVQPVAIDATYAYIVRSGYQYDQIRLSDGNVQSFASPVPGSSQGISDVNNGILWWADTHRTMVVAGVTLTYPNRRGDVIVGQSDPPQIAGVHIATPFTAFTGDGFEPHVATNGTAWAICARTPAGAAYLEVPPFPPFVTVPPTPEPPDPEPPDPPDPEPPQPEPPDPTPEPEPPYPPIGDGPMQTERGWLLSRDHALACDANGVITFPRTALTDADLLEATPIDGDPYGRAVIRPVAVPTRCLGMDATEYNPDPNPERQLTSTTNAPGYYEYWAFGQWPDGIVTAEVVYKEQGANHGRPFHSAGLTWVKQA